MTLFPQCTAEQKKGVLGLWAWEEWKKCRENNLNTRCFCLDTEPMMHNHCLLLYCLYWTRLNNMRLTICALFPAYFPNYGVNVNFTSSKKIYLLLLIPGNCSLKGRFMMQDNTFFFFPFFGIHITKPICSLPLPLSHPPCQMTISALYFIAKSSFGGLIWRIIHVKSHNRCRVREAFASSAAEAVILYTCAAGYLILTYIWHEITDSFPKSLLAHVQTIAKNLFCFLQHVY